MAGGCTAFVTFLFIQSYSSEAFTCMAPPICQMYWQNILIFSLAWLWPVGMKHPLSPSPALRLWLWLKGPPSFWPHPPSSCSESDSSLPPLLLGLRSWLLLPGVETGAAPETPLLFASLCAEPDSEKIKAWIRFSQLLENKWGKGVCSFRAHPLCVVKNDTWINWLL